MKNVKHQIQYQLLQFLKSQDIHTIKVKQLVDSLNIGRSTFYLYYDSVFSVLQDIEDTFFEGLQTIANLFWSYPPNSHYLKEPHPIILKAMVYLKDNQETAKILWGPYGDQIFKIRCQKMVTHAFYPKHIFSSQTDEDMIYHSAFMVGGHLELVNCWINRDCDYPVESVTLLIYRLMYGVYK